ncbi:MAG: hypothetical protein A3J59_00330 [Candidatus Buchananbacteria bacterium RIFCSPHIGHO2_02_FULL_56_16]|uniref:FAD-binding FR-type domain-containing protein n=1 Tax=Candidatus Buchananbacteria bacterium RIFCSPHIGHO2_02_FULL_56_16 TaxID=1797542 RepID=A0A1G1YF79_9BACT|nr:MAG: hypothetical protein A3J59_00330 [Candidatus Buchananbacteria bacterium RIFCSPHIGHO2_02_FULL_56_16]
MYPIELKNRTTIGSDTTIITAEKPDRFQFTAGQFTKLILPNLPATSSENWRWMSIASAPAEPELMFYLANGVSAYKRHLAGCPLGSSVAVSEPRGKFLLADDDREVVFLAGGVGIAPVRSMLVHAAAKKRTGSFWLFYSNANGNGIAFDQLFQNLTGTNLTYVPTITKLADDEPWTGERGRIDAPMLRRHFDDLRAPRYYAVGSPEFVRAMVLLLRRESVSLSQITVESFTGL